MTLTRRQLLCAAAGLAAAGTGLVGRSAKALGRPRYGGRLRVSLPLGLERIDPHDPHDPLAALLAPSLFETLYGGDAGAGVYPTLAEELPLREGTRLLVTLRPGLESALGQPLDAGTVARSLVRSREATRGLGALGAVRARGGRELLFDTALSETELALTLSGPRTALVPRDFSPSQPDTTGALMPRSGLSDLVRNPRAPRGGSLLDGVSLATRELADCLRDFETGRSDLTLLGRGLHRARGQSGPLALDPLGFLLLVPGTDLGAFAAPGVLSSALERLDPLGLRALGVALSAGGRVESWAGPAFVLRADRSQPWLVAVARELARQWSRPDSPVLVEPSSSAKLRGARAGSSPGAELVFIRGDGPPGEVTTELFALAGATPPQSGTLPTPEAAARRLATGVVGKLSPAGAARADLARITERARLTLADAELPTG